jgi:hypothetical protein
MMHKSPSSQCRHSATRVGLSLTLVLSGWLSGCSASPHADEHFGSGVRSLRAAQTLDPDAGQRHGDQIGTADGRTVREAMERRLEGYRAPPQPTVLSIGTVGGAGQP